MNFQSPALEFVTNENVDLLWEIILENRQVNNNREEFRKYFIENLKIFFQEEQQKVASGSSFDLFETNKQFITRIISHGKPAEAKPVTAEEIQKSRMNEFEQEFHRKQNEFKEFMSVSVPEIPQFTEKIIDEPIGDTMKDLITRTLAQRNFDLDQIQSSVDKKEVEKWLKGENTSVKQVVEEKKNILPENKNIKYITIGDELNIIPTQVVDLVENQEKRKKISWDDEVYDIKNTENLFSKLKRLGKSDEILFNETIQKENSPLNISQIIEKIETAMIKIDDLKYQVNTYLFELKSKL